MWTLWFYLRPFLIAIKDVSCLLDRLIYFLLFIYNVLIYILVVDIFLE